MEDEQERHELYQFKELFLNDSTHLKNSRSFKQATTSSWDSTSHIAKFSRSVSLLASKSSSIEQRRRTKMHKFCLTLFYTAGGLLKIIIKT